MTLTSKDAWSAYADAVLQQATAGQFNPDTQTFSLAGQTLNVDLANADPIISNANIFGIGNSIPAPGGAYTPGSSLIDAYNDFLEYVKLEDSPIPTLQRKISIAADQLTHAKTSDFLLYQSRVVAEWETYKKSIQQDIPFEAYAVVWNPQYMEAISSWETAFGRYHTLMGMAGPAYEVFAQARVNAAGFAGSTWFTAGARAILEPNNFNMPVGLESSAPAGSGPLSLPGQNPPPPVTSLISTYAPGFTLGGNFLQKYQEWQKQSGQEPPEMTGYQISLDASSSKKSWSDFGWGTKANASFPVSWFTSVQVAGQASFSELNFDYSSSRFRFDVSYLGSSIFPISPNLWFNLAIVKDYRDKLRAGAPDFFGEEGSLARFPVQAVIGFQPKIKMTVSESDYRSFKSQFQESTNVAYQFGPFTIGSANQSVYSEKSSVKFDDSSSSFEVGPVESTLPMLIGILCAKTV